MAATLKETTTKAKKYSIMHTATGLVWGIDLCEVRRQLRIQRLNVDDHINRPQAGERIQTPNAVLWLTPHKD